MTVIDLRLHKQPDEKRGRALARRCGWRLRKCRKRRNAGGYELLTWDYKRNLFGFAIRLDAAINVCEQTAGVLGYDVIEDETTDAG